MKRFTLDGSDALERHLERICQEVLRGVEAVIPASRLEALVLGGGYGRGEGGVLRSDDGDQPYNDIEFYVFVRGNRLWNDFRYHADLSDFGERLSVEAGLHVEFKIDSLPRLERGSVSMFSYDLISGHRLLMGDDAVFKSCGHHLDASKIPLSEATRLLFNRCSGLLLVRRLLRKALLAASDPGQKGQTGDLGPQVSLSRRQADFIGRNLAKAQLALGDALLAAFGQYHWSCPERHRRLERLVAGQIPGVFQGSGIQRAPSTRSARVFSIEAPPALEQLLEHHAAGVEFKLHPQRLFKSAEAFAREHAQFCALASQLWLWLESRRLEYPFSSARDYAMSAVEKCPETSSWRNYLLNARAFGPASLVCKLACRYPRERLLNALALLLWSGDGSDEPGITRHLQKQLQTRASDWPGFVRAYERAWLKYG